MNSYTLKINKEVELPEPLEMGYDYTVQAKLAIKSIEKIDQDNGEFEYAHKGQLLYVDTTTKQGKSIKAKAKGSQSQKLRWEIMQHGDEEFYKETMSKIINNLEEILIYIK